MKGARYLSLATVSLVAACGGRQSADLAMSADRNVLLVTIDTLRSMSWASTAARHARRTSTLRYGREIQNVTAILAQISRR